jgi:hypothetical protein
MSDKPVGERLQVKGRRRLAVVGASAIVDFKIGLNKQRCDISEAMWSFCLQPTAGNSV